MRETVTVLDTATISVLAFLELVGLAYATWYGWQELKAGIRRHQ